MLQRVASRLPAPINLTRDSPVDDSQPAFSPKGELIAFRSERDGGGISLMDVDGRLPKRLTRNGFNPAGLPTESNGSSLVLWSERRQEDIYLVRPDGGQLRPLTRFSPGALTYPVWSPDGLRILATDLTAQRT
jgi:Tol biopolymer transport system component